MPQLETLTVRSIFATLILLVASSAHAGAQQSKEAALVNAVLDYRAHWVGDSTRFDACSVYEALGRPASFPAGIDQALVPLLDRPNDPCAADSTRVAARWPRYFVRVDSVTSAASRVVLTVVKHEHRYHETYTLRAWPNGGDRRGVSVAEVRTWGLLQSLPVPPGRRLPSILP